MPIQDVTPADAHAMRQEAEPPVYLDVRSVPEFQQGHPAGAYNIPVMHMNPQTQQMEPNADFERVVQAAFPQGTHILVGCKSGGRSVVASQAMEKAGYTKLCNVLGGFHGGQDELGEAVPGWQDAGLPTSREPEAGRDYDTLLAAAS